MCTRPSAVEGAVRGHWWVDRDRLALCVGAAEHLRNGNYQIFKSGLSFTLDYFTCFNSLTSWDHI